jgi:hypothetical protein
MSIGTRDFTAMLQGGSDPGNTDPLATAPPVGEEWVSPTSCGREPPASTS